MSDQGNIFGGTTPAQEPGSSEQTPATPSYADKLAGITNESGEQKYASVDTALDALAASQQYIPQLHAQVDAKDAEIQQLKLEVARAKGVEEAMSQFNTPNQPTENQPSGLDEEGAKALLENMLAAKQQEQARENNTSAVTEALQQKYGEKAEEVFYSKAEELGLTREAMNNLAGTSPAAVLAYFETSTQKELAPVETKSSIYVDTTPETQIRLERNQDKSVLMGSTSADVRREYEYNKQLVAAIHAEGGSVEDLTDPKMYKKYFANRE